MVEHAWGRRSGTGVDGEVLETQEVGSGAVSGPEHFHADHREHQGQRRAHELVGRMCARD
jgi:hypothetical protein